MAANVAGHGVWFHEADDFDWESAVVNVDSRRARSESRLAAVGYIGDRLHVMVFTLRVNAVRIISLRRANRREVKRYAELKPGTRVPTLKEDAAINAGIKADRDNPEWNDADFARAKPAVEFFDAKTMAALVTLKRRPGERGPQKTPTKERISIRLSHDVVETFRASGEGWQTRIDDALRDYVAKRSATPRAPVRRRSARAARAR